MKNQGFTVIEIAFVLLVVIILLSGMLMPLAEFVENAKREQTQIELESVKEAFFKFLIVNRRFPCPALLENEGLESRSGNIDETKCSDPNAFGFVPWKTLNIAGVYNEDDLLVDVWGNPYHYVLSNTGKARSFPACIEDGKSVFASYNKITEGHLCKKAEDSTAPPILANLQVDVFGKSQGAIVAVVFSTGKNGFASASALEAKNFGVNDLSTAESVESSITGITYTIANDREFFYRAYNPYPSNPSDYFDDLMVWISTPELVNRMVKAGILP